MVTSLNGPRSQFVKSTVKRTKVPSSSLSPSSSVLNRLNPQLKKLTLKIGIAKFEDDSISVIGVDDIDGGAKLRRPSPPRHKRRGRDEEDDEQEMREKASKVSKSKRRGQPVLDDDEDDLEVLAEELNDGEGGESDESYLKVSLARPPKPRGQSSSKPSSPTVKSHKPQQRDGSSRQQRRERRDDRPQQERPELIVLSEGLTVHEFGRKNYGARDRAD